MSALTTRILVLGVVSIFGPANGYQLRRELLSWEVERWAHLNPGSIYSMLSTLEKQGAIERHDIALDDGGRPVAVYTVTDAGAAEFTELLIEALATVPDSGRRPAPAGRAQLRTGSDQIAVPRSDPPAHRGAGDGLRDHRPEDRCDAAHQHRAASRRQGTRPGVGARDAQLAWLRDLETDVAAGTLSFADDANHGLDWEMPADDPGWAMAEERERYAARIAEQRRA